MSRADQRDLERALFEGRYDDAFEIARRLREQQGTGVRPEVLYAGACALFGLGHVLQAEEWVEAHGEATRYGADSLYLSAYLEIQKRRLDRALLLWTRIVQIDPAETFADQLIEKLKRSEAAVLNEAEKAAHFTRFVPLPEAARKIGARGAETRRPGRLRLDPFWKLGLAAIGLVALAVAIGLLFPQIATIFEPDPYEAALETLPEAPASGGVTPIERYTEEQPRFVYAAREEALMEYNQARGLIFEGRVNEARRLLGRIELSNASFEIKERALMLRDAIPPITSRENFKDPVEPDALRKDPYIYRNAQILWSGVARDVNVSGSSVRFFLEMPAVSDLQTLVLYVPREGAPTPLRNGDPVSVFGSFLELRGEQIRLQSADVRRP